MRKNLQNKDNVRQLSNQLVRITKIEFDTFLFGSFIYLLFFSFIFSLFHLSVVCELNNKSRSIVRFALHIYFQVRFIECIYCNFLANRENQRKLSVNMSSELFIPFFISQLRLHSHSII